MRSPLSATTAKDIRVVTHVSVNKKTRLIYLPLFIYYYSPELNSGPTRLVGPSRTLWQYVDNAKNNPLFFIALQQFSCHPKV
ncbi:hypothetical protein ACVN19_21820, partial [Escherichia coli]